MIIDTYSIFWREMKRYKKSRGGFIIRLIQPAVWIIVMGNIFSGTQPLIESVGFDGEYIEFMTPGIIIRLHLQSLGHPSHLGRCLQYH